MKVKQHYAYQVGGIGANTREAARIIQRSFRDAHTVNGELVKPVPRIIQKVVVERVIR